MIESPRNQKVREVRRLAQKAERTERAEFVLEGPQAVREGLSDRPDLIGELFITPTALERHRDIGELAERAGIEVLFASEEAVDAMADTRNPQGVIAVARQFPTALKRIFDGEPKLVAILEEVRDPGNLGTIIRLADAAGADAIVLTGRTVDLYNAKVVRSTTGSLFHVPIAVEAEFEDAVVRARAAGLRVVAADVRGGDLLAARDAGELAAPTAWVFGNEARGLPEELVAQCDASLSVPIYGSAESMNLATAASVCLYESAFAQRTRAEL
ncbi:RNA methyltransferase [Gulosibacter sp. 10]|uniref:TrmH family RNA methyltransferase n=1 Tax=Gulosibacter sp. 10 TaxID=1255570 RepID=UPI00097F688A|nr:RNA methyltransferase [Gulosibacter sp. 10]SJM70363.1 RNA methyltransferase, TrmH family [Gulosibacter sp. 10]